MLCNLASTSAWTGLDCTPGQLVSGRLVLISGEPKQGGERKVPVERFGELRNQTAALLLVWVGLDGEVASLAIAHNLVLIVEWRREHRMRSVEQPEVHRSLTVVLRPVLRVLGCKKVWLALTELYRTAWEQTGPSLASCLDCHHPHHHPQCRW